MAYTRGGGYVFLTRSGERVYGNQHRAYSNDMHRERAHSVSWRSQYAANYAAHSSEFPCLSAFLHCCAECYKSYKISSNSDIDQILTDVNLRILSLLHSEMTCSRTWNKIYHIACPEIYRSNHGPSSRSSTIQVRRNTVFTRTWQTTYTPYN